MRDTGHTAGYSLCSVNEPQTLKQHNIVEDTTKVSITVALQSYQRTQNLHITAMTFFTKEQLTPSIFIYLKPQSCRTNYATEG